jgi:hypothetical protein
MKADLTKLIFHSGYSAFKNNAKYSGTVTISGTAVEGTNQRTYTIALPDNVDMCDVTFNGDSDEHWESTYGDIDRRPSSAWFKKGAIWVRGDNAGLGYTDYPTSWVITSSLSGSTLTITATYVQGFTGTLTLTSTNINYKLVDYSVF